MRNTHKKIRSTLVKLDWSVRASPNRVDLLFPSPVPTLEMLAVGVAVAFFIGPFFLLACPLEERAQ